MTTPADGTVGLADWRRTVVAQGVLGCLLAVPCALGFSAMLAREGRVLGWRALGATLLSTLGFGAVMSLVAVTIRWLDRRRSPLLVRVLVPWLLGAASLPALALNVIYAALLWRDGHESAMRGVSDPRAVPGLVLIGAFVSTVLVLGLGQRGVTPWHGRLREVVIVGVVTWAAIVLAMAVDPDDLSRPEQVLGAALVALVFMVLSVPIAWALHALTCLADRWTGRTWPVST